MENERVNWSEISTAGETNFFQPELGREYVMRFKDSLVTQIPEKKNGVLTGNQLPAVRLLISELDGVTQEPAVSWDTNAKTLLRALQEYGKSGALLKYSFKIVKKQIGGKQYPEYSVSVVLP